MPELLSPAGNYEKMVAAIHYGADAVYLAGGLFGMRAAADNFTPEEMRRAVVYAHERGVKVYVTVNTMPRENEYPMLRKYIAELREIGPDALIVADIGVMMLIREVWDGVEIHVSTQANTVSAATCRAWHALGAKRVVLSRELTLEEIKNICAMIPRDLEIECFIHGSMCVSYSGRCLLSNYLADRDANHGACTQPCRWNYQIRPAQYEIVEEKRPETPLPIEEHGGETFIMSAKDMCMIEHVPELIEAGITSFKIEGRMKSAYYTAVVTNAYRMAIRAYENGIRTPDPAWLNELESVSHREYATGYYYADSKTEARTCTVNGYLREKAYLATVLSYDSTTGEALCVQRNKLVCGTAAELLTPGEIGKPLMLGEMFDEAHIPIDAAPHPGMRFYIKMPFAVAEGDILRGGNEK